MQAFAVENHHRSTTRAKTVFVQLFQMISGTLASRVWPRIGGTVAA